jgi:gamma-glutamylcyclotransferase (GGCT)/AIG2-like uncharacterized protein YtfP
MIQHVVVYGTLRLGQMSHAKLGPAVQFVAKVQFVGTLIDLGPYPGVLLNGTGTVIGDLFKCGSAFDFSALDRYEHYNSADISLYDAERDTGSRYVRRSVMTSIGVEAFVYEFNGERISGRLRTGSEIPHGDWQRHLRERTE